MITLILAANSFAQEKQEKVYKLNPWIDGGIVVGSVVLTKLGLDAQAAQTDLSEEEVLGLDPMDVNAFDRGAIYVDPDLYEQALINSDIAVNATTALVLSLALDKRGRRHWLEALVMFVEVHGINGAMQSWTSYATTRYRPITYVQDVEMSKRTDNRNRNSFYSGHTSSAASSSFFVAKMFSDLHPELGNKKYWLFGAALIPPAVVGAYRIMGGKHFYTDVIVGTAMGAATGIMVPHFHKTGNGGTMSVIPVAQPDLLGMYFKMQF